uniref:Amino acid permease n=1 Tax=Desulfomonile tiedjei TaxID=2358 RepID=A0A7C4ASX0_9BACT
MKIATLLILNAVLLGGFIYLLRKPGALSYYHGGRVWLSWLAVGVITLMDELTSVFYAPAEAFRFIGPSAIVFLAVTSLLVRYMSTRFVEIGEILAYHQIYGGGVYSFSYLVLGPSVSFIAVASIMVDYILTACLSSVSAVSNAALLIQVPHFVKMLIATGVIWAVAGLNILGIRENARFTFGVFILASLIFVDLIVGGVLSLDHASLGRLHESFVHVSQKLHSGSLFYDYGVIIASVASCILAYSGVESVLQTAGLVRSWREIARAYVFLGVTVGVVTPVVAALALSAPIEFSEHEGDLIPFYASLVNGVSFGVAVAMLASITLIMAVNTAFVASSELLERVAARYAFLWLIKTNRNQSLYRIHIVNACLFSAIIFVTHGSQMILADMYAIGLVASFCINIGALLIYRYFMGTQEIREYHTSRLGTLVLWVILLSCFGFLTWMKPHGTQLWLITTTIILGAGLFIAQKRAPEIKAIEETDSHMNVVAYLAESSSRDMHVLFTRPKEEAIAARRPNEVYITFYNPRHGAPTRLAPNHFRLAMVKRTLYDHIVALLKVLEFEFPDREIHVHFGWPLSSWIDRLSIGVMVYNIMGLPKLFENMKFTIHYPGRPYRPTSGNRSVLSKQT